VNQAAEFLTAIDAGCDPDPSFAEGLEVQQVLDAVVRSDATHAWTTPMRSA
jgi:predicted dehydrogenase